ncbi:hypothetical protein LWI29_007313 [Acer saccharum]|uniref:Uncharacterized protein n=1 Tax=Acer saccharum TaxID=4024 RepID=A0AA39SRZ7_ACESA|nr:hypothetical protein LWI29_007313 [Acer saccharum]
MCNPNYEKPIYGELARVTKIHEERKKTVHEGSKIFVKVRTPSKKRSRSSKAGVATLSRSAKVSDSSRKLFAPEQDKRKKKKKGSSSVYLASSNRKGLTAFVVDSLCSEEENERPLSPREEIGEDIGLGEGNILVGGNSASIDPLATSVELAPRELKGTAGHPASLENLLGHRVGESYSSVTPLVSVKDLLIAIFDDLMLFEDVGSS